MFEKIDKIKNKKNALIGLILIIFPLFLYLINSNLKLPNKLDVENIRIIYKNQIIDIDKVNIDKIYTILNNIHGKYLVLSKDGTDEIIKIILKLKSKKEYKIIIRKSTIEYNGYLYDINPDNYEIDLKDVLSIIDKYKN